jgi:glycosyltransferase involved in cell wall biosynthesis
LDASLPRVSVIVPTYNRRPLLEQTLQSLRSQDYGNYEVLVCDDSSTDDTFEFLTALQSEWEGLKVFRNEKNLNFNGTLQRLFSLAQGDFIGMQHDHDIYKPHFLSTMIGLLLSNPKAGFACSQCELIDQEGRPVAGPALPDYGIFRNSTVTGRDFIRVLATQRYTPVAAMSTVFRRSVVESAGGYKTDWYLASDEDLYRRLALHADVAFCPEPLLLMRLRPVERQKILGSWKSIYTLFLFRLSTAISLGYDGTGTRNRAVVRQFAFKWRALLREGLWLWMRGETSELKDALKPDILPILPTDQKAMHKIERLFFNVFIWPLLITVPLGRSVYAVRKILRAS